jgi:hypothetical protein
MERRTPPARRRLYVLTQDFGKMDIRQVLQVIGVTSVTCAVLYVTYRRFEVTVHYKYHSTVQDLVCPSRSRRHAHAYL